eukprot:scaffold1954_cov268-Pinguiococcus_pyrenoidosus.AAC.169
MVRPCACRLKTLVANGSSNQSCWSRLLEKSATRSPSEAHDWLDHASSQSFRDLLLQGYCTVSAGDHRGGCGQLKAFELDMKSTSCRR